MTELVGECNAIGRANRSDHPTANDLLALMVHAGVPEQGKSVHGRGDPTRSGQLAANIEQMVVHLVDGVHGNPPQ